MNKNDFILFSGAAPGAEAEFGACAERHGIEEVNFTFDGHTEARRRGIRVEEYAANRIKQSLTGHGHASKPQMQRAIQHQWNLKDPPEPPDVADALAVALCCGQALGFQAINERR